MRLAVSNLSLPAFDHASALPRLTEYGVTGLQVAPFHTFHAKPGAISAQAVGAYWGKAATSGLEIIGLHALTGGPLHAEQLTIGPERRRLLAQLIACSALCRDLGGRSLILGARSSGALAPRSALVVLRDFLEELLPALEPHGTVLCLAPLAPGEGDLCATANDCYLMTAALEHPSLALQLGSTALSAYGKVSHTTFALAQGGLELFQIDEPGYGLIGSSREIDHVDLRLHLVSCGYKGWVSVVQREDACEDPLAGLARSLRFVREAYLLGTAPA